MEGTIGEIRLFAADFAPKYWALCQGQLLGISTNQALFSILGTIYGGNGVNNFALPDMMGRVPGGTGTTPSSFALGAKQGVENITLQGSNLPPHNHTLGGTAAMSTSAAGANIETPGGNYFANDGTAKFDPKNSNVTMPLTMNINAAPGAAVPLNNMMPYLGINYIICLAGIFPSRN